MGGQSSRQGHGATGHKPAVAQKISSRGGSKLTVKGLFSVGWVFARELSSTEHPGGCLKGRKHKEMNEMKATEGK